MTYKYTVMNCTKKEGLIRVVVHVDNEKYSIDYSPHEYEMMTLEHLEEDIKAEVLSIITKNLKVEMASRSYRGKGK